MREGLGHLGEEGEPKHIAGLSNLLGLTLQDQGDLAGALEYTRRALDILESTYGKDNPTTRAAARNLEVIKEAME